MSKQRRREAPEDLAEMRDRLGGHKHLMKHYKASSRLVRRWLAEAGLPPLPLNYKPSPKRPPPDDFLEVAGTMSKTKLKAHYGTSDASIRRWFEETGAAPWQPTPAKQKRKIVHYAADYRLRMGKPNVTALRNYDEHDIAADVLRPFFPVYRCDERGRQNEKGTFWRVGNAVVDGDELLARAARKRRAA